MKYEIQIIEPWNFEIPVGGNVFLVQGIGLVSGPDSPNWQGEYFLVELDSPFEFEKELVQYLILSPRYVGETIEDVQNKKCTIGIARVKPEYNISIGQKFSKNEIEYCAIGSIKPFYD